MHSTSWMPASSRMARAAPPAITPVPGAAGLSSTRPAPSSPMTGWTMVVPASGDAEEVLASLLGALLDGEGHLLGLAVAEADAAGAVADHHERGEREATTALDDLGDAVDVDDPRLAELQVAVVVPSELQSCFTGGVGDCRDAPVVHVAAAVEHDRGDAGGLGPLGDELCRPWSRRRSLPAPVAQVGLERRRRGQRACRRRRR